MDAEMATGVDDLISQATFGALSQSELDCEGRLDGSEQVYGIQPRNSRQGNRANSEQEANISGARGAAERYRDGTVRTTTMSCSRMTGFTTT